MKPNIVTLPKLKLPDLEVASTSFLGNRVRGSRSEIWLCPGYSRDCTPLRLFIKLDLPTRAIMAEALCALLAKCLDLSVPQPFLVTVRPGHVGRTGAKPLVAFGSRDLAERSMARPVQDLERLLQLLQHRKVADLACVFDEWVANPVRSPSDILVSPDANIYLIDHEAALAEDQFPDQPATNWLANRLIQGLTDKERIALLRQLRGRLAALHRVELEDAPNAAQFSVDGVTIWRTLLQFLRDRLGHLDRLISERIVPEQRYLFPLIQSHDPGRIADV